MTYFLRLLSIILLAHLVVACATGPMHTAFPDDPDYAPVKTATKQPEYVSQGSLYLSHSGVALFDDRRAYRVGDIITVELNERTVSSKSTEASISKNAGISIGDDVILSNTLNFKGHDFQTSVDQDRTFDGSGEADQQNSLVGSIAVTVSGIMPNGLLIVRGEKWLALTNGEEFIRLKGLIRPEDITATNTISSTKVANARISYSGTGELADASRQGWVGRFFSSTYWPF